MPGQRRHWLIPCQGQGARLFVYVMLGRHSLHPSSDAVSKFQGLYFGTAKAAAWAQAWHGARQLSEGLCAAAGVPLPPLEVSPCFLALEVASPTYGAQGLRGISGRQSPALPRGLAGSWLGLSAPFMQHSGASGGSLLPDTYTVFVQRQSLTPAAQETALVSP